MSTEREASGFSPAARVIGGGMGGCEAAWQLARRGIPVELVEMRGVKTTPAHRTDKLAEIVCSNSFKSEAIDSASGLLKAELRLLGSLLLRVADTCRVPAGQALAVDRELFADGVSAAISAEPLIRLVRAEETSLDPGLPTIVATGPLTSGPLADAIAAVAGRENLHFFDAIAPVISADSIDMDKAWAQSRYDKGEGTYINCPLDAELYGRFISELREASAVQLKDFEKGEFFEACLPIEVLAKRGEDALRFGPMKPVGLTDPRSDRRPHAVVQLRQDDIAAELWGMVGFQTNLRFPDQERIFRMIPGLEEARFARHGQMHRNAYVDPPATIHANMRSRTRPDVFIAGQLSGVEGYIESGAAGLIAALNVAADLGRLVPPPDEPGELFPAHEPPPGSFVVPPGLTMTGALVRYVTDSRRKDRQPMNAAFGLLPTLAGRKKGKRERYAEYSSRAMDVMSRWARAVSAGSP